MRLPLPVFLSKHRIQSAWIYQARPSRNALELLLGDHSSMGGGEYDSFTIFCIDPIDYSIRPPDPRLYEGAPPLEWSNDDLQLADPLFQYVPGGDGERFDPPRRWEVITINQSYVVAARFEIEPHLRKLEEIKNPPGVTVQTFISSVASPNINLEQPLNWDDLAYSGGRRRQGGSGASTNPA